jgi:diaminohydroxyphosphoribosylaminopyrimidine deaminase / 5-amino-6-(5-phosphoribosylamino)uracil reductase
MSRDERYMARALELARLGEGRTRPNPAVGAVIVRDGEVVGEGYHPQAGEPHAEIFALRQAGERARGAELFVTLEPCSHHGRTGPCVEAVLAAGIRRVCVGVVDPNPQVAGRGIGLLQAAGVEVRVDVLGAECRQLIAPFAKHITTGLPFVVLKSAMTLDGRTATVTGDSHWITGAESRAWVHQMRNRLDAVMVGIGTLLRDDPLLTTRLPEGGRDAVRIIVDSRLRIPETAAILAVESAAPIIIATTSAASAEKIARLEARGVQILVAAASEEGVDMRDLLRRLGAAGIQSILLEGGNILNASALRSGLIDRVMIFIAPLLLGSGEAPGIFAGRGPERLAEALKLTGVRVRQFADDTLIEGEVCQCSPV